VAAEKIDKFVGGAAGVDVDAGRAAWASSKGGCFGPKGMWHWGWMWEGGVLGFWSQTLPVAIHYYCRCVVAVALKSKFKVAKVQFTFYPYLCCCC